jgi:hypothetical protein
MLQEASFFDSFAFHEQGIYRNELSF